MTRKTIAIIAILVMVLTVACGQDNPEPEAANNNQPASVSPASNTVEQNSEGSAGPESSSPSIANAGPTTDPMQVNVPSAVAEPSRADTSAVGVQPQQLPQQQVEQPAVPESQEPAKENNPSEPAVQAPRQGQEKPGQFNELQVTDIYAGMDLDQLAITREQWEAMKIPTQTRKTRLRDREEKGSHHYGHMAGPSQTTYQSTAQFGPRHFLENPWFVYIIKSGAIPPYRLTELGAAHLARKSTMGILAQAVAEGLESRIKPGVEPYPINLSAGDYPEYLDRERGTRVTNMKEYLQQANEGPYDSTYFTKPTSQWEFIHPELPIVRVLVEHEVSLPLAQAGGKPEVTRYQAGFVISFQNRWQSFDDPNRWLLRFRNTPTLVDIYTTPEFRDLKIGQGEVPNKAHITWMNPESDIAPEAEYGHRFWHYTDYMQHRLIGPVWIKVVESNVLEPGVASVTPQISQWEAPGPIVPDEHLMAQVIEITRDENNWAILNYAGLEHLKILMAADSPNPGFPLPGHVTATGNEHYNTLTDPAQGNYRPSALPGGANWAKYCQHEYFREAFTCPP